MKYYDYLVVGAGLYGAAFARGVLDGGGSVLVIERRRHIAGNAYTERVEGIDVHRYGAHIFHTNSEQVWRFVNRFATFNRFTNSPVANYKGELYSLPFNMHTFHAMWGVVSPREAEERMARERDEAGISTPRNLEEQAICLVGREIYEKLVRGYTEKQWGRPCRDLPTSIIRRLPVRYTFDDNYFDARYQGIPEGGYTKMVEKMLSGADVALGRDYLREGMPAGARAGKVVFTGPVDEYFSYARGPLAYRSLRFETETLNTSNYQGVAVMNYTDRETPYTRVIEHKWFTMGKGEAGSVPPHPPPRGGPPGGGGGGGGGGEPLYPLADEENRLKYAEYRQLAEREKNVIFGGRLGEYRYYDMDAVIASALAMVEQERGGRAECRN